MAEVNLSDSGVGAEALSVERTVVLSDTGTATETVKRGPVLSDSASGVDALTIPNIQVTLSDEALASEAFQIEVSPITLSETGTGSEEQTRGFVKQIDDSGSGSEALRRSHVYRQAH